MRTSVLEKFGFVAVSNEILLREAGQPKTPKSTDPHLILIFGWGNALPQHVAKYSEGFRTLFPSSKQVIVLSEIATTLYGDLRYRSRAVEPLVKLLVDEVPGLGRNDGQKQRILVHCMSNTGGIKYAALLNTYRNTYGRPFPHSLIVFDSTPGSPYLTFSNLKRWSHSMAINTAAWFPWPFVLTQCLWATFLCFNSLLEKLLRRESAPVFSTIATNDDHYEATSAHRQYIYSKEDSLIAWNDIEDHAANARAKGYIVRMTQFEGTAHVAHMRSSPERYWSTISASWQAAV